MKFCMKCGAKLPDDAEFCGTCGTKQPKLETEHAAADATKEPSAAAPQPTAPKNAAPQQPTVQAADIGKALAQLSFMEKLGYLGAILVGIASFLPFINLAGFMNLSLTDVSNGLMVVILVTAIASAFSLYRGVSEVLAPIGTGLLVTIIIALLKYFSLLSEAKKSAFGAMAGSAVKLDWGFYILLIGTILVLFAGLLGKLRAKDEAISGGTLLAAWKDSLVEKVQIEKFAVPGWAIAVVIVALLVLIFTQAKPMQGMKW
ncbi:zinc ribbon domain-containing protein [uncultured Selenomonas sp.]|uniref:zinc ribbon domain-containing protein n=1 Tax=uncultured Selenomonas sp. TaxID=159275 RepID=UPI0025DF347D|nr:zinc ribbon domain-containing protein [uncultured Selenomonas sp.]